MGLSVSRVGGDAQTKAMKKAAGTLRLDLAQYREMEVFTQFSSDLDETTKRQLIYGQGLMRLLRQPQYHPYAAAPAGDLAGGGAGPCDAGRCRWRRSTSFAAGYLAYMRGRRARPLCRRIDQSGQLSEEDCESILQLCKDSSDASIQTDVPQNER